MLHEIIIKIVVLDINIVVLLISICGLKRPCTHNPSKISPKHIIKVPYMTVGDKCLYDRNISMYQLRDVLMTSRGYCIQIGHDKAKSKSHQRKRLFSSCAVWVMAGMHSGNLPCKSVMRIDLHRDSIFYNCFTLRPAVKHIALQWRHNDHDGVSNHQPHGCLLKRLFRRRSNKTSKLRVTGLCGGNSPGPVNFPHKGPVTQKMFSFNRQSGEYSLCSTLMTMQWTIAHMFLPFHPQISYVNCMLFTFHGREIHPVTTKVGMLLQPGGLIFRT